MSESRSTEDLIAEFRDVGYILVRDLFDQDEMAGVLASAKSSHALNLESKVRKDAAGGETRLVVRNELDDDSIYTAAVRSKRIVDLMEQLLADEVYHYHHKMMMKEPRGGGAWEWHQDYGYWYNFGCLYPDMASCFIAVDRSSRENGCLQVLRGSHKIGRLDHGKTGEQVGADLERVAAARERHELVYCEMDPGDALFFHSNLLHRSDQNLSDHARWSLICCYNTRHNDPIAHDGKHPNYSPLERWPDERVREILRNAGS
jgi:ectoine hydroxylase-related dioxygenase (phytanoyl-CoA dioxygenase family)